MKKYGFIVLIYLILFSYPILSKDKDFTPIPDNSKQMIIVIVASQDSSKAFLVKYERSNLNSEWRIVGDRFDVIVGKHGLAWGNGLHSIPIKGVIKKEGDYKSPEGVFSLSSVFGFANLENIKNLKMPYIHVSKMLECVDDKNSKYYNNIIERNLADSVDWNSSEKMIRYKTWYELGVVVNHNTNPIKYGNGSCIFLHYWEDENDITSGCTAMDKDEMHKIVYWLDSSSNPVLVQLSSIHYEKYKSIWNLPEILN